MIIIECGPLESISNIRDVRFIVAGGRMFNGEELWQSVGCKP
jgi:hypothetical protein